MDKKHDRLVKIETFGNVDKDLAEKMLSIVVDCFERLGPPMTYPVTLSIHETSKGLGFFASHDASDGKPVINIYLDRISGLPAKVVEAGVRRQSAHSILHGSPEYYMAIFPDELKQAIFELDLSEHLVAHVLQGAYMGAKEYNVTKFLVEGGFVEDQIAYAKFMLEPSDEDLLAWKLARRHPTARIIYLVLTIRDISCAIPLLGNPNHGWEIIESLEGKIKHLQKKYRLTIQKIIGEVSRNFSEDTFNNINFLIKAIVKDLIRREVTF
ncbi:MAG: hypothetical protein RMJ07_04315 [Nitrososphaerota archaeon]|nr:hypothetical protein [Candidatus Bathyarchaeota archaeon]MDW8048887.1 hypothetical protein [Nitrososphaerota archaeon]